jgi:hypothetical protein
MDTRQLTSPKGEADGVSDRGMTLQALGGVNLPCGWYRVRGQLPSTGGREHTHTHTHTKAQCINESLCIFVAGRDGRTANAEHWRQQQQRIYIVYVPPQAPCPWFGMSAMFRAMAAEVR